MSLTMVTAEPISLNSSTSPCLATHEKNLSGGGNGRETGTLPEKNSTGFRRPRNREITSRYKSPTTPSSPAPVVIRRFPSPNVDRVASALDATPSIRAQSAERRRPSPTRTAETKHSTSFIDGSLVPKRVAGRGELLWPSTRNISSSPMQGEYHSPPSNGPSKGQFDGRGKNSSQTSDHTLKPSANVAHRPVEQRRGTPERKGTPLRRQILGQAENARPAENVYSKNEQHRWPGSSNAKVFGGAMSKSMDLTVDREKPMSRAASLLVQGKPAYSTLRVPRPAASSRNLSQSINEGPATSIAGRAHVECRGRSTDSPRKLPNRESAQSVSSSQTDLNLEQEKHPIRRQSGQEAELASIASTVESRGRSRDSPRKLPNRESAQSGSSSQTDSNLEQEKHPIRRQSGQEAELASIASTVLSQNISDIESVSSGGTAAASPSSRGTQGNGTVRGARGTTVPARFWQDASSRSRRPSEINRLRSSMAASDLLAAAAGKLGSQQKTTALAEAQIESIAAPSSWSFCPSRSASTFSTPQQAPSPAKLPQTASPTRSFLSPTRSRGPPFPFSTSSFQSSRCGGGAVTLSSGVDGRKGKKGLSQLEEGHLLRILHNRMLQWRFVNARAETAMNVQRHAAEKSLYNVWARTSELQASVTAKRIKLQQARQAEKLYFILSAQASKLEDWSSLHEDHSAALSGAIEALEAAILRVPVIAGVRADIQSVKEAMGSAVDVMTAIESSVTSLTPKAEKTNCLVSEVAHAAAQERALVEECGDLLVAAAALEAEERSLRTHLIQLEQERARVLGHLMDSTKVASDSVLL